MNDQSRSERAFKPFTRVVTAPPAWPWDQTRAATLEAQHTSPVSGDDVVVVVRRLKPWSYGQEGKFCAIYLRGADIRQGLKFDVDVQGHHLTIDMPSPEQKARQASARAWVLGFGGVIIVSLLLMGMLTMQRRTAEADQLTQAETLLQRRAHEAEGITRAKANAQALAELNQGNHTLDNALADLKMLSLRRDSAVRIDAFYWNKGYWAVEAHGTTSPVPDATVPLQRSSNPVRKDVWLWVSAKEDGE